MKLRLKAWRKKTQSSVVYSTDSGLVRFSELGEEQEVSDTDGHRLISEFPDMLEVGGSSAKAEPEAGEDKPAKRKGRKVAKNYQDKALKAEEAKADEE